MNAYICIYMYAYIYILLDIYVCVYIHYVDDTHSGQQSLNRALSTLIEDYSMVSFVPLDITDDESIETLVMAIDTATQYGEDVEPKDPDEEKDPNGQNGDDGDDDGGVDRGAGIFAE